MYVNGKIAMLFLTIRYQYPPPNPRQRGIAFEMELRYLFKSEISAFGRFCDSIDMLHDTTIICI